MNNRPIIFSAAMVRALLSGGKTQTRRVMNQQPNDKVISVLSPYGPPGSTLWVRETCRAEELDSGLDGVCYLADGAFREIENTEAAADQWLHLARYGMRKIGEVECRTVPANHMPRWASRITLEITGIRVERLQDISEADAIAEGLHAITKDGKTVKYGIPDSDGLPGTDDHGWPWFDWNTNPVLSYRHLWESIYGTGSWDANPWVWVIEFEVMKNV